MSVLVHSGANPSVIAYQGYMYICFMQNEKQIKNYEEAVITTDAYRIAFEEQLDRNRLLMKEIVDMTMLPVQAKMSKAKSAMKWLIQQLNEGENHFRVNYFV